MTTPSGAYDVDALLRMNPQNDRPKRRRGPRMTRAKAERLVAALAAVAECDDSPWDASFDDVRAALHPWMEDR